jgi:SCP-2 sterol transfer family
VADKHRFLSPEWITAAKAIREEYRDRPRSGGVTIRMNQVITDAPGGEEIHAHLDAAEGDVVVDLGHLDGPDLTITTDYATARAIFVNQDAAAGMQAFMSGKIKVEGDMAKLLMMQAQGASGIDPVAAEIASRVKDITSDE